MSGFFHGEFVIEDLEELQRVQSVMEASLWVHKNVLSLSRQYSITFQARENDAFG